MVGRTGARLRRLETLVEITGRMLDKQNDINLGSKKVFDDILARLTIAEELQDVLSDDVEALKQSNFDYQIKLLSSSLDEAQAIIDRLQNTVWRRFCRWIRLLFTV